MADAGDDVAVGVSDHALTVQLKGDRFRGGRLPLSSLDTLTKMDKMVTAIARDLEVAAREGASRPSRNAKVELVLVGEIEDGSAIFRLLIAPLFLAASGPSTAAQAQLLQSLPEAVPAVVQAVHEGHDLPHPVSAKTVRLVAEVGKQLGASEELILRPHGHRNITDAVDDKAATVTRASAIQALHAQEVSVPRSFFITGTIRRLENHGDEPGQLTLATTSGLYPVPDVSAQLVARAASFLSQDRNAVLALSGQGVFDGKGRLKSLTHVTQMRPIDRHFNPDRRFAELVELAPSDLIKARIQTAQPAIERATLATGRAPGLFLDEDDQLEARWLVHRTPEAPAHVVSASFGAVPEVYVFDRAEGKVVYETALNRDDATPGDLIANVIQRAVEGDNG